MSKQVFHPFYWDYYRNIYIRAEPGSLIDSLHWFKVRQQRKICKKARFPGVAIYLAPPFDKQYFLSKWWARLQPDEKVEFLTHVWLEKGPSNLLGFDWWLPYFEDTGFITNCGIERPTEEVLLYRGTTPLVKQGMSWTPNLEEARFFANGECISGMKKNVYKMTVSPDSILAIFAGKAAYLQDQEPVNILEYVVNHRELDPAMIEPVDSDLL